MARRRASFTQETYPHSLQNAAGTQLDTSLRSILSRTRRRPGRRQVLTIRSEHAIAALEQSYLRHQGAQLPPNTRRPWIVRQSSNNTVYADAMATSPTGRGISFPAATRTSTTPGRGGKQPRHQLETPASLDEIPHLLKSKSGFLSRNDSPWNGARRSSLRRPITPAYVEQGIESARGHHASSFWSPAVSPAATSLSKLMHRRVRPRTLPVVRRALAARRTPRLPGTYPRTTEVRVDRRAIRLRE